MRHPIRTIIALSSLALATSAIAEPVSNPDGTLRTIPIHVTEPPIDTRINSREYVDRALRDDHPVTFAPLVPPPSDEAVYGRGQSFTIVNLPNGQTATAITFH
jgi:hypothetical protein